MKLKSPVSVLLEQAALAAIVEFSDDAIVSKDLNGIINSWNKGAERIFGYTGKEAVGQPVTILMPPERYDEERHILERIRQGERVDHYETVRKRKDGALIDVSVTISPIKDTEGAIVGASKIARDITARKQADIALAKLREELAQTNEALESRIQERTADLQRANASLLKELEERRKVEAQLRQSQKLESIGTLAGGIAHDFNNILNIIRGYTSLLGRVSSADEKSREILQVIEESIDRGASVVRQLLAIARKTDARFEQVDVNATIEKLRELLSETFPKTINISLKLEPRLPPIVADSTQLIQALLNLCVNARDAMPEGGELHIETGTAGRAKLQGRFNELKDERYAYIMIRDTGTGIDEKVKSRIFDPFFTTKEPGLGSGLGLSVVYGIVTNHAGFIDVSTEPGRGTTFAIYLPIPETEKPLPVAREQALKETAKATEGETILFVDDEVRQLDLMQTVLEREGYRVLLAKDGAEAVETYTRHKNQIALVVLDLGLPKLNGWEALQRIQTTDPAVKAILATGYVSPELESEIKQGKVAAVILKPYRINEVLQTISTTIHEEAEPSASHLH